MTTLRQRMIAMLSDSAMDVTQLAQRLALTEKEVSAHLPHIDKTVKSRNRQLRIDPAVCRQCGFVFKTRRRFDPPGRCPQCKGNRIEGPWFQVTG